MPSDLVRGFLNLSTSALNARVHVCVRGCVGAWVRGCVGAWLHACVCVCERFGGRAGGRVCVYVVLTLFCLVNTVEIMFW